MNFQNCPRRHSIPPVFLTSLSLLRQSVILDSLGYSVSKKKGGGAYAFLLRAQQTVSQCAVYSAERRNMHFLIVLLLEAVRVFILGTQGQIQQKDHGLYRDPMQRQGDFVKHPQSSLNITPIVSFNVTDNFCCVDHCLSDKRCFSYNLAVKPINNLFNCQLLSTDKYNSDKFGNSMDFHHYSTKVSCTQYSQANTRFLSLFYKSSIVNFIGCVKTLAIL